MVFCIRVFASEREVKYRWALTREGERVSLLDSVIDAETGSPFFFMGI